MKTTVIRWMRWGFVLAIPATMVFAQANRSAIERSPMGQLPSIAGGDRGSSVTGPSLGYVVDASTGSLHIVNGIAGSSIMGSPVHRGSAIRVAAIAPLADYAVVADESGAVWFYGRPAPRGNNSAELSSLSAGTTHLATSPNGDRFVAYAADSGSISIFEVSNGIPRMQRTYSVSLSSSVSRIALPDGAGDPVLLTRDGSGSTILRAGNTGVSSLAVLPGAIDLAFFRGSEKALVLDASQNAVYEADFSQQNPALRLVASSGQGINEPVGFAISEDNKTVAVANAGTRKASVVDIATSAAYDVELPEPPTGVRRMNSRAVFQLTDASSGPMLLLDVQGATARTVYVPVAENARSARDGRVALR